MRFRNVKNGHEKLASHSLVIKNPQIYKGKWNEVFENNNPIHIEIGMGKGQFILEKAKRNQEINFIGFEKFTSILARAVEQLEKQETPSNLLLIREDAGKLEDIFEENEVEGLYLNFSDPWPKDRHAKRRLTHNSFLEKYKRILKPNSRVVFKTDNEKLFDFSLEEIKNSGFKIKELSVDLHNSALNPNNIMTEYEEKFAAKGMKICFLEAINVKE